jgi:ribosomal protein S10
MFAGVAVDGLTSFVARQSSHVDLDISDDDTIDEEDDEVLSVGTKRASSTSTTASSPNKRSKSPAVRSMDGHMREHNDISRLRLERMTSMWQQRNQAIED